MSETGLAAFASTWAAIEAHNKQFGLGAALARALIGAVEQNEAAQELIDEGATPDEALGIVDWQNDGLARHRDEESLHVDLLGLEVADSLASVGLVLTPARSYATVMTPQGNEEVGEVRVRLRDPQRFTTFLVENAGSFDEYSGEAVLGVARMVVGELRSAVADREINDDVRRVRDAVTQVADALRATGVADEYATRLELLAKYDQQGVGAEYVAADDMTLFADPTDRVFPPAQWHLDSTHDGLTARWRGVTDLIDATRVRQPGGQDFARHLAGRARLHLDAALAGVREKDPLGHAGTLRILDAQLTRRERDLGLARGRNVGGAGGVGR
ncbi:MAG: hypothetical protein ACOYNI_00950 [Acidimicrobiia bacterium]